MFTKGAVVKPFREIDLSTLFSNVRQKIQNRVDAFSNDEIMANSLSTSDVSGNL